MSNMNDSKEGHQVHTHKVSVPRRALHYVILCYILLYYVSGSRPWRLGMVYYPPVVTHNLSEISSHKSSSGGLALLAHPR